MLDKAPLFDDVTEAPAGGQVLWRRTSDGLRLRLALWPAAAADSRGTVLLFPGRTEYIEKYGPAALEMAARGYGVATLDWRGQGLSDRLLPDRAIGHVGRFGDYQADVAALRAAVQEAALPGPFFLMAHSMGGCIGLRALHDGLPVRAVAFSGPMWGIRIAPLLRPLAWALATAGRRIGRAQGFAPGTVAETYVRLAEFDNNLLTTDAPMWAFMRRQVSDHPDLALGGPSLHWLHEALVETRALRALPPPALPCYTAVGRNERIVDTVAIERLMERWPGARLDRIAGAEHEVMMESPARRARFYDQAAELFARAA